MLGRQILKSHFGKHYKIHFLKDGPVPRSLKPVRFSGAHGAQQFLLGLKAPPSYWQRLSRQCDSSALFHDHQRDHLQAISNSIVSGRIRIYEVELPDTHALSRSAAAVQDRQGYQYQFVPMRQALATPGRTPQRFNSAQQVYKILYDLAPNLEQLQALATTLQITHESEQQTYTQLIEALAEGLAEQRIALYITAPFKRPEPTGAALESATNMPGNRQVELAPAAPAAQTDSASVEEVPNKYVQQSPIDFDHVLKADYTKNGKPTGGHTLLYGDVRIVPGTESVPDVAGVYKATIQVPDPANPGQWITKTSNNSTNTMFPEDWDEIRVKTEVDAAWNNPNKIVQGDKWISVTPSGVKVEGWISPRATVYPVYQAPKKP